MNGGAMQLFEGNQRRREFLNFSVGENKNAASKRQKGFPTKEQRERHGNSRKFLWKRCNLQTMRAGTSVQLGHNKTLYKLSQE